MSEFEIRTKNFENEINNRDETDLALFNSENHVEICMLKYEIRELEMLAMESTCQYFSNSVYNYTIFLEWCIEQIEESMKQVQEKLENIMINTLN